MNQKTGSAIIPRMENLQREVILGLKRLAQIVTTRLPRKHPDLDEAIEWIESLPSIEQPKAENIVDFPIHLPPGEMINEEEYREKVKAILSTALWPDDPLLVEHLQEEILRWGKTGKLIHGKLYLRFYNESNKKDAYTGGPFATVRVVYNTIRVGEGRYSLSMMSILVLGRCEVRRQIIRA